MRGFCSIWVCVCVGFLMCGCVYVWDFLCVGVCMCDCFENCLVVLVICVLLSIVFYIEFTVVLYCIFYVRFFICSTATE
jgi:hypothetical protein